MDFTKSDYKFFEKAKQIAEQSDYKGIKIGCIAVLHGKIIAYGVNSNKTHPLMKAYNRYRTPDGELSYSSTLPKLHAEISCLAQLKNVDVDFPRVKLYIFRGRKDRPLGMSRPCPSCYRAICDMGIRHIYYTTNEGYAYEKILEENKE